MELGIEENLDKVNNQKAIVNTIIETQTCLQLLVSKGLATREEVAEMRNKVKNNSPYKEALQKLEVKEQAFKRAEQNPEEYLKAILNAKLNGKL